MVAGGDGVVRPAGRGVEGGLSPWHDGQGGSRDGGEVPPLGVRLCWRQAARLRRCAQAWRTKESYKSSGPGHSEALTKSKCVGYSCKMSCHSFGRKYLYKWTEMLCYWESAKCVC